MTIIAHDHAHTPHLENHALLPGVALAAMPAAVAFGLHALPGIGVLSPMILSILLGIAFHNLLGTPARAKAGVTFALRRILRFAIILLGLQLTAQQVAAVGGTGVAIIAAALTATFLVTKLLGRLLGVERGLAELIAAGTSICGASAVIAVNTVTDAKDEDVAYAIACVTVFGSIAMFLYPLLPALLHLSPRTFGLWSGASIHEIAQVVAAAFQDGSSAGKFGTIAKLTRVSMLAPVVLVLGFAAARQPGRGRAKTPMPWFVLGFVALVAVNSLIVIPAAPKAAIAAVTTFLLSVALAAMGLETDLNKLAARGMRPAALGALSSLFISGFSLGLIKLFA
ncbi:MAG TPA: YeiH family protein [Rhizomicrobium sp.]|nr:YeiH family protein [Rhizomicrobium sp.]